MSQPSYSKPPITEAIIQIHFKESVNSEPIDKVVKKFSLIYTNHKDLKNISLKVNLDTEASKANTDTNENIGHLFASDDFTQQLSIWENNIANSQLAPYTGWDNFINRFQRDFSTWKKIVGFKEIKHIGVRYINRIDMPSESGIVEHETYLNLYPAVPRIISPIFNQAVQVMSELPDIKSVVRINSAMVQSPLPEHISIIIDQDIIRTFEPPQNEESILEYLNEVRHKKNDIFESCITDRARELFK